jgi:cephalosporin-C deacetylase-like acetyl esterase
MHPYWAAFGYACVRVDIRGSGESDLNSSIYTVILRSLIRTLLFKLD